MHVIYSEFGDNSSIKYHEQHEQGSESLKYFKKLFQLTSCLIKKGDLFIHVKQIKNLEISIIITVFNYIL